MHALILALLIVPQAEFAPRQATASDSLLAWGEWDGDGLPDAVLLEPGVAPRLMRNTGDGPFEELGARIGLPTAGSFERALWCDFDLDGRQDLLLVSAVGGSRLLRNAPSGVFEDVGAASGLPLAQPVRDARWIELNADGRMDLELATERGHRLFTNRGDGSFASLDWLGSGVGATALAPALPRTEEPAAATGELSPTIEAAAAGRSRSAPTDASGASVAPTAGRLPLNPLAACVFFLKDQATAACLRASSMPTLGLLYPLSNELNVDLAGHVGMGTTTNTHKLTVEGTSGNDVLRLKGTLGATNYGARLDFGDPGRAFLEEDVDNRLRAFGSNRVTLGTNTATGQVYVDTSALIVNAPTVSLPAKVGFGVAAPAWAIDAAAPQAVGKFTTTNATNGSVIELRNSTPGTPTFLGALNFANNAGQFPGQIAYTGLNALTFRTGGFQRMLIDGLGRVGIGTTAPGAGLDTRVASGIAVRGESDATHGIGVRGWAHALSGLSFGVSGRSESHNGAGVYGVNVAAPVVGALDSAGVLGEVSSQFSVGVWGRNGSTSQVTWNPIGVLGTGWGTSQAYGVFAEGRLGATGTKTFVQPHPEDASKSIQFICLEGNEAGTYCRGRGRVEGGVARIALPEEFGLATSTRDITAQVTPRGTALVRFAVASCTREELVVVADADIQFDWTVNGLRRAFEDEEIIVPNTRLRPRVKGVPFIPGATPAYRALLVEAGITNADGTPNEATAARLGWELLAAQQVELPAAPSARDGQLPVER